MVNVIGFLKSSFANRGSVPVADDNPLPVTLSAGVGPPATEQVSSPTITSAGVYSANVAIGAPITISSGGMLMDLSFSWNTSQTQNISALVLRGPVTTASTLADHSSTSIAAADAGKIVNGGYIVMSPNVVPGAAVTNWIAPAGALGIVVSSGYQVAFLAGGTMNSAGAATSGVTVGIGIV